MGSSLSYHSHSLYSSDLIVGASFELGTAFELDSTFKFGATFKFGTGTIRALFPPYFNCRAGFSFTFLQKLNLTLSLPRERTFWGPPLTPLQGQLGVRSRVCFHWYTMRCCAGILYPLPWAWVGISPGWCGLELGLWVQILILPPTCPMTLGEPHDFFLPRSFQV